MESEHWFPGKLRELSRDECLELLQTARVGRVAFDDGEGPVVVPVNYVMEGETILVATAAYTSLGRNAPFGRVAFQLDHVDEFYESGWSVLVRGRAEPVTPQDLPADMTGGPTPWVEGPRTLLLRVTPSEISGRRIVPT